MISATRPRRRRAPAVAAAAALAIGTLALAACGGDSEEPAGATPGAAAKYIPADSPMYVEVTTDLDGPQWTEVRNLATLFPDVPDVEEFLTETFAEEDIDFATEVRPLLGERMAMGMRGEVVTNTLPSLGDPSSATAPEGEAFIAVASLAEGARAQAEALVEKSGAQRSGEHAGATLYENMAVTDDAVVIADTEAEVREALDAHAGGDEASLAGSERFNESLGKLPQEVFAQMFIDVGALAKAGDDAFASTLGASGLASGGIENGVVVASVLAEPEGVRIKGVVTGVEGADSLATFAPELVAQVPADAFGFVEIADFGSVLADQFAMASEGQQDEALKQIEAFAATLPQFLGGVTIDDLRALVSGRQLGMVVPSSTEIPGVVLVAKVDDPARATRTLDAVRQVSPQLLSMIAGSSAGAPPPWTPVELAAGVSGWQLPLEPGSGMSVVYAVSGDVVFLGSSPEAVRQALNPQQPLSASDQWQAGTSGMPGEVTSVGWLNPKAAVEALAKVGAFTGSDLDEARDAVAPIQSIATWNGGGSEPTFEIFARIAR